MKNRPLFIGNFLSKHFGTTSVSESIINDLSATGLQLTYASSKKNKLLRLFDVVFAVCFRSYSIVHVDVYSGSYFRIVSWTVFLARLKKRKVILTLHGGKLPELHAAKPEKVRYVLSKAHRINSPSQYLIRYFENQGFQISYVPNSVDLDRFPFQQTTIHNHSLLWVRAFSTIYSPETAINALSILKTSYPDANLTMVGPDKGELHNVKKRIASLGLEEAVRITGPIANNQLSGYFNTHSVFLNTTTYESFGVSVVEAAASGIPIVSNKVGELPYIWEDHKNILFIEENDPISFANAIEELWSDPELIQVLKKNARKQAESFDRKEILKTWISIFE